jgi:DNA-binding NtrC family response regulator
MPEMLKTKILIVEDEPEVRDICAAILRSNGFGVIVAVNGLEGLEAYQQRHEEICLVLSDISMPLMGGVEMTRKLFEMYSHVNVILMSGYGLSDILHDDLKRLCSVIDKPFTVGRLLGAVKECLEYDAEHSSLNVVN